jgi:hypothetical protein
MKEVVQKVNLMLALTSMDSISEKVLESSSMKNKEIKRMIDSNNKKRLFFKR